jgi:hypothetical protein
MKPKGFSCQLILSVVAVALLGSECFLAAQNSLIPPKGPGDIVVSPKFGGQIAGYDIDQNGTEGVLTEQKTLSNGNILSAVETFDQRTGKIIKVIRAKVTQFDDDIVIGIVGTSTAIILHEHAASNGTERTYHLISPLDANKYTGLWQPSNFDNESIVLGVSRDQGAANAAFLVLHNIFPGATNFAFGEDVAKNAFGQEITMTEPDFEPFSEPAFAFDVKTNTGVLAGSGGCDPCTPEIGLVNLVSGEFSEFQGLGKGSAYGLAVDSDDGIACTTTSDANVEFYDLKTGTGLAEDLPGGEGQPQSGFDVEFDPIHKLFLIFQGDGPGEHSFIQVYDPKGNLVDSIDFGPYNRFGGYIALHPTQRSGFLGEGPVLRSFTY